VEVYNAICRKIVREGSKLIDPIQRYVDLYRDAKDKCRFLASLVIGFLRERLGIEPWTVKASIGCIEVSRVLLT